MALRQNTDQGGPGLGVNDGTADPVSNGCPVRSHDLICRQPSLDRHEWCRAPSRPPHSLHLTDHPGDEDGTDFPLRSIIADAALHGSAAILLAHNHPSGDSTPSDGDKRATRRLACAAEALDCAIADHLVFGRNDFTSFRALGLL